MPIEARRRFGATLLGAALGLSLAGACPAWAQGDAPAKVDRTWTDPPARGSAATAVPETQKTVEMPKTVEMSKTVGAPRAPKPVGAVASNPVRPAAKARLAARSAAPSRVSSVAPRVDGSHRRVHTATVVRPPATIHRPGVRMVTLRSGPLHDDAPFGHGRYGYAGGMQPGGRIDVAFESDRDRRIRQAREAGYVVVRARTLAFPDGRRLRSYRPYDPDDFDD